MVGQEHVLRALVNALDNQRLHHAYLFTGTRGVGKTTVARILARCLNCEQGIRSEPCDTCSSCAEILEGRSVDLLEVDAASRTKVEDTRDLLDNVQYLPTHARFKIYLIDEVHMLSASSFNALLKTLEEPPPHVKFLLATTDPQKLPATVLSRCLQFNLKNMAPDVIVAYLQQVLQQESISYEDAALWLLARSAAGSMRDALSLTDQAIAFGSGQILEADTRAMLGTVDLDFVLRMLGAVAQGDPAEALAVVASLSQHSPDYDAAIDELIAVLHRIAVAQAVPEAVDASQADSAAVQEFAQGFSAEDVQLFYQMGINGKRDMDMAADPRSGLEMVLLRMIAFRPEAALDSSLTATDLQQIEPAAGALEGVAETKKSVAASASPAPAAPARAMPAPPPVATEAVDTQQQAQAPVSTAPPLPAVDEPVRDAADARPASGDLSGLHTADWPRLLPELGLAGILRNIAEHCVLHAVEGNRLSLCLDEDHATLFRADHSAKMQAACANYFGTAVVLTIEIGKPQSRTPAELHQLQLQQRQAEAEQSILDDQLLAGLIERFDGQLDPASIAPDDNSPEH